MRVVKMKPPWAQPAKGRSQDLSVISTREDPDRPFAEETDRRTRELLATRGWCLWQCSALRGEVIAVVRDELVKGGPEGYPVYTVAELEELCHDDISEATLRLVHEAKKLAGATVDMERRSK